MALGAPAEARQSATGVSGPTGSSGQPAPSGATGASSAATGPASGASGAAAPTGPAEHTEAERIIRIRRLLESDQQQLEMLKKEQTEIQPNFDKAAADFEQQDVKLTAERAALARASDAADKAKLTDSVSRLERGWTRRRDVFDRLIQRRKVIQLEMSNLTEKIAFESEFQSQMLGTGTPKPEAAPTGPASPPATGTAPSPPAPTPSDPLSLLGLPFAPGNAGSAAKPEAPSTSGAQSDPELVDARKADEAKQAALKAAQARAARLARGVDVFERDIASSRDLLDSAKKEEQATIESLKWLDNRIPEQQAAKAPEEEIARLTTRRSENQQRLEVLRAEIARQTERLSNSELTLATMKKAQDSVGEKLKKAEEEAKESRSHVRYLEGPLAPHQITYWFLTRAPRVLVTLVFATAMLLVARAFGRYVVGRLVRKGMRTGGPDREGRGKTLERVFQSSATVTIIVLGVLGALNQAGIDVTVLLGSAAVVGAAVAFGSQNLIKDFFSGFMILLENQYSVGNVVRIGDTTGTVEDITLRMTAIRDLEGVLHFIPHSQVTSVSNLTYGWSRIVMDVKVASGESVDRVMKELVGVAQELKADSQFGPQIFDEPEMLGVDAVGNTSTTIKLLVKTRPLNRWTIKRELLRRIKLRFDQVGIKFG